MKNRLVVIVALVAVARAGAATLEDAQRAYEAKDYRAALSAISDALNRSKPDERELRHDLYALRGEVSMQMNNRSGAVTAFRAAQRNTQDPNKSCLAQATLMLIGDAVNWMYTPPRGGGPFDIREQAPRQKAYADMFANRLAEIQPRAAKEETAKDVTGILSLLPDLSEAYALERAATGGDEQLRPILNRLGGHARELVSADLNRLQFRIETLESIANDNSSVTYYGGVGVVGPGSLTSTQKNELADTGRYLLKIRKLCQGASTTASRMNGAVDQWNALAARCDELIDEAATLRDRS